MSSDNKSNLNAILGQLEDELVQVRSAREQVDDVLSANEELGDLARQSEVQVQTAIEALKKGTDGLAERADYIERMSSEAVEAVRKQSSDAQATLEKAADAAVEGISLKAAGLVEQVVASLNEGVDSAKKDMSATAETLNAAASDFKAGRDALLEAHESIAVENNQQIAETVTLIGESKEIMANVDAKAATIASFDMEGLSREIRELKEVQVADNAALQKQLKTMTIMVGVCVVMCVAMLLKLLIG